MNLNQVEAFLSIVRLGSLSKAANNLFVSQSTISQRLHSIEEEYEVTLLNRDRGVKGISLTNNGERFYQIALKYEALFSEARNVKLMNKSITVTIGAVDSVHNYILRDIYTTITKEMPNVRLAIRTYQSNEIYSLIDQREIEIGFPLQERIISNVNVTPLFTEEMVLIQKKEYFSHFSPKIIANNNLNPENQLLINWGSDYRMWHEKHWGPITNTHMQIDTAQILQDLMQQDNLWAIVPVSIARNFYKDGLVDVLLLDDPPPPRTCYHVGKEGVKNFPDEINQIFFRSKPIIDFIVRPWEMGY